MTTPGNPVRRVVGTSPQTTVNRSPTTVQQKPSQTVSNGSLSLDPGLQQFKQNDYGKGKAIIIVGKSGIGKTSLAAEITNGKTLFVVDDQETGITDLISAGQVKIGHDRVLVVNNYNDLLLVSDTIKHKVSTEDVKTVVFESYTGFEKQCMTHVCNTRYEGDWGAKGFLAFQQGPRTCAAKFWPDFIVKLEQLRLAGFNVVLTCHTQSKTITNPNGENFDGETVYANSKDMWQATHRWAESIWFYVYEVLTTQAVVGKAKATAGFSQIVMNRTPHYEGKNRWGVQVPISCGDHPPEYIYKMICAEARLDPATLRNRL